MIKNNIEPKFTLRQLKIILIMARNMNPIKVDDKVEYEKIFKKLEKYFNKIEL